MLDRLALDAKRLEGIAQGLEQVAALPDPVGAITGETGLAGKQIGSIEIADKFSLVEVPEKSADDIIRAMKKTTIKGRKVVPRRERFQRFER
jgi:hypothetical protein